MLCLEIITCPSSRYQAYRPGSSIFARGLLGPRANLARGQIWSAGPICLVTRRWTCFKLFITCFFFSYLYYIFTAFKILRSIQVQIQDSNSIHDASIVLNVIILLTSCFDSGPLWVHARVDMDARECRLWVLNHEPYRHG